jgi:D-hydroxyproline dehydrogenase subunit gamma
MMDSVTITVNGVPRRVSADAILAAALLNLGHVGFRYDLHGAPRAPLCGMGSCYECRVIVDGVPEVRSCLVTVREGMHVETAR